MKKKTRKYILAILFIFFSIFLGSKNELNAQSWVEAKSQNYVSNGNIIIKNGSDIVFNLNSAYDWVGKWLKAPNAYCIQHPNDIYSTASNYRQYFHFVLNNNRASGTDGSTNNFVVGNWMSYLLANGYTGVQAHTQNAVQNILWDGNFKWFLQEAANAGIYSPSRGIIASAKEHAASSYTLYHETNAYLAYKRAYKTPSQVTTTPKLTVVGDKCKVGPLRINYTKSGYNGKLFGGVSESASDLVLYDKQSKVIDKSKWRFVNSAGSVIEVPEPNTDFYIEINLNSGASSVGKLSLQMRNLQSGSEFYLLKNNITYSQKIVVIANSKTYWEKIRKEININIDLTIDLGGNVFIDNKINKINEPNGYKEAFDDNYDGVTVNLYKKGQQPGTTPVATAVTKNGRYDFKKVNAAYEYYIEFIYNGQKYEPTTYKTNGRANKEQSHATEGANARDTFNKVYTEITSAVDRTENTRKMAAYTGPNGLESGTVYYSAKDMSVLQNINLGVIEREDFDFRLSKDLYEVKIKINGKEQNYRYSGRENEDMTIGINPEDMISIPLSNGNVKSVYPNNTRGLGKEPYERAIRKSDLDYKLNEQDQTGAIEMYATYVMRIYNQSNAFIDGELTCLIDYYDENFSYDFENQDTTSRKVINNKTTGVTWKEDGQVTSNGKTYKRMIAENMNAEKSGEEESKIQAGESEYVYVTYKVNVDELKGKDENTKTTRENYAEIGGYKTYYHSERKDLNNSRVLHQAGQIAGLIDKDSDPRNFNLDNREEEAAYEDDADKAPNLSIVVKGTRTIAGNVWEDSVIAERLKKDNIRVGDGVRQTQEPNQESGIQGLNVDLVEIDEQGVDKRIADTTITKEDGTYSFTNYIPGNYIVRFRYGEGNTLNRTVNNGKVYSGQDYKSTLYEREIHEATEYWYTDNQNNKSDAADKMQKKAEKSPVEPNSRKEVNGYSKILNNHIANVLNTDSEDFGKDQKMLKELEDKTKMQANTAKMSLEVEYARTHTFYNNINDITYDITNLDFGIVERPRSELTIKKEVSNLKIITADGQTLFDSGKRAPNLEWTDQHITAIMDENLMHGANMQITYKIVVENTGELDYINEYGQQDITFYNNGIVRKEDLSSGKVKEVKTKPDRIIDYIANNLSFDPQKNPGWEVIYIKELQRGTSENPNVLSLVDDKIASVKEYNTIIEATQSNPITNSIEIGEKNESSITLSKVITSEGDLDTLTYKNNLEIIQTQNDVGRRNYNEYEKKEDKAQIERIVSIPGNLDPKTEVGLKEPDSTSAQLISILPPYGANKEKILYYMVGAISLGVIMVAGIIVIKMKVLPDLKK